MSFTKILASFNQVSLLEKQVDKFKKKEYRKSVCTLNESFFTFFSVFQYSWRCFRILESMIILFIFLEGIFEAKLYIFKNFLWKAAQLVLRNCELICKISLILDVAGFEDFFHYSVFLFTKINYWKSFIHWSRYIFHLFIAVIILHESQVLVAYVTFYLFLSKCSKLCNLYFIF